MSPQDQVPAPEARVREFVEMYGDKGYLAHEGMGASHRTLATSDVQDVLNELEAALEALEWIAAQTEAPPMLMDVRQQWAQIHAVATFATGVVNP